MPWPARVAGTLRENQAPRASRGLFVSRLCYREPPRPLLGLPYVRSPRASRESTGRRDEPVPPAARAQPGRLAPLGTGSPRGGQGRGQADLPLDRVLGVPLVPRHG